MQREQRNKYCVCAKCLTPEVLAKQRRAVIALFRGGRATQRLAVKLGAPLTSWRVEIDGY